MEPGPERVDPLEPHDPTAEVRVAYAGQTYPVQVRDGLVHLPKGFTRQRPAASARPTTGRTPARIALKPVHVDPYGPAAVTRRLVGVLGSNAVADLLGVSRDRPGRWSRGEVPDRSNLALLADLDALIGHLLAAFTPEQAGLWLTGDNAHLGGRPVDVFRLRGSAPVIDAVQAHQQGASA